MITLQDIFNAAWQAFIVEDRPPAANSTGNCSYLTNDGRKCAVGLCLPDGHPSQQDGGSLEDLVKKYPDLWKSGVHGTDGLNGFQFALHDNLQVSGEWCYPVDDRRRRYIATAIRYGLTVPEGA